MSKRKTKKNVNSEPKSDDLLAKLLSFNHESDEMDITSELKNNTENTEVTEATEVTEVTENTEVTEVTEATEVTENTETNLEIKKIVKHIKCWKVTLHDSRYMEFPLSKTIEEIRNYKHI